MTSHHTANNHWQEMTKWHSIFISMRLESALLEREHINELRGKLAASDGIPKTSACQWTWMKLHPSPNDHFSDTLPETSLQPSFVCLISWTHLKRAEVTIHWLNTQQQCLAATILPLFVHWHLHDDQAHNSPMLYKNAFREPTEKCERNTEKWKMITWVIRLPLVIRAGDYINQLDLI